MSANYPRVHTNLHSLEEWNRRGADAINYLLSKVATKALLYGLANAAYVCNLLSPSVILEPYVSALDSAYADGDPATGSIVVTDPGLYTLNATVIFQGGANQQTYALEAIFTINGVVTRKTIATTEFTNQTTVASLTGQVVIEMGKEDSCAMGIFSSAATTLDILDGEMFVEQVA